MIKIGCAAYSYRQYFQDGSMTYESFIEKCHQMELDGVELTLYWLPTTDNSYLRKLKKLALSHGLTISAAGTRSNFSLASAEERKKQAVEVGKWIRIANVLGAPCLRIFGGQVPEGATKDQAIQWAIEGLKLCIEDAEENGIVLALENHNDKWVTGKADDMIRIIEEVDSEWLRVNLDVGNYYGDIYDEIAKTVPYTVHIHARQRAGAGPSAGKPEGVQEIDYMRIKNILESKGYNGFVSLEYEYQEPAKTAVPNELEYLLKVFR